MDSFGKYLWLRSPGRSGRYRVTGTYWDVSLDFALPRPTVVEFPIRYLGGTGVFFDRLVVTQR